MLIINAMKQTPNRTVNGSVVDSHICAYDALCRPTSRNPDAFGYNERSEVVSAQIGTNHFEHAYDYIGNHTLFAENAATNTYTHNNFNQVTASLRASASLREICHDHDGNLTNDWVFA